MAHDKRHGGPYDRGSADAWYGRDFDPHYFVGDTYSSDKVDLKDMSVEDIVDYTTGYKDTPFAQKEW